MLGFRNGGCTVGQERTRVEWLEYHPKQSRVKLTRLARVSRRWPQKRQVLGYRADHEFLNPSIWVRNILATACSAAIPFVSLTGLDGYPYDFYPPGGTFLAADCNPARFSQPKVGARRTLRHIVSGLRLSAGPNFPFREKEQSGVHDEEDQHGKAEALAFLKFRFGGPH
jgi:hypothetical protein